MNKAKFQLSKFDIGMIAAFVCVSLIGAAAWWYLSGALQDAQGKCAAVAQDYNKAAVAGDGASKIIVSAQNAKNLDTNNGVLQAQIDPIISAHLLAKDNDLAAVRVEDPVAWKLDLDTAVKLMTAEAGNKKIKLPDHFYFGFSRYQTESPGDAATAVLTKQRKAIKAIVDILVTAPVDAPVTSIAKIQRSYEEDAHGGAPAPAGSPEHSTGDQISGGSVVVPNMYTAYPFEVDFDAAPESLRPILDALVKAPYLFIVRSVEVRNEQVDSPRVDSLAQMSGGGVGAPAPSLIQSGPGDAAAAATPALGPQFLFGYAPLHVKLRIDLIEWNPKLTSVADLSSVPPPPPPKKP